VHELDQRVQQHFACLTETDHLLECAFGGADISERKQRERKVTQRARARQVLFVELERAPEIWRTVVGLAPAY